MSIWRTMFSAGQQIDDGFIGELSDWKDGEGRAGAGSRLKHPLCTSHRQTEK
jgi:hypothetical protein